MGGNKGTYLLYNGNIYTPIYLVFTYMGDNQGTFIIIKC